MKPPADVKSCGDDTLASKYMTQQPRTIVVGASRRKYYLFKDLLVAKSPYFASRLKDRWGGSEAELELLDAPEDGFEIVVDWMVTGKLPLRLTHYEKNESYDWGRTPKAYKVADFLIMHQLQNELVRNEAGILCGRGSSWNWIKVAELYGLELGHTPYYDFVVKSFVERLMSKPTSLRSEWERQGCNSPSYAAAAVDVLIAVSEWNLKPWKDFMSGDLTEFMVKPKEQPTSSNAN